MALFKICRGAETNLPTTLTSGYCYFCTDTTNFYIDYTDTYGALTRAKIASKYADKLRYTEDGNFIELDPTDIVTKSNYETAIGVATSDKNGLMSSSDKTKLDGIASGAGTDDIKYVAQELTEEQRAQARSNIAASPIPRVRYWTKPNIDNIIDLYNMGVGYGIVSPFGPDQTVPSGMKSPMLIIFGYMSYGSVEITVYDGAGAVWRGILNLSSESTSVTKTGDYVTSDDLSTILQNYATTDDIPDVPAWAKSPTKPTYTAAEVGALPDTTVIPPAYTLPQATADVLGGIKADVATVEDTQDVRIGADGKLKTKPTGGSTIKTWTAADMT